MKKNLKRKFDNEKDLFFINDECEQQFYDRDKMIPEDINLNLHGTISPNLYGIIGKNLTGRILPRIYGCISQDLSGNISKVYGDVTGIVGNIDDCDIQNGEIFDIRELIGN